MKPELPAGRQRPLRRHGSKRKRDSTMAEVILENVYKIYDGTVTAVRNVNLEIRDREFMVLVGPSGCGKSTTLRMIAGLEDISKGTIKIADRVVNNIAPKDRDIAMVFQNYALYPHMSVYDNMAFGLKIRHLPKAEIDKRVHEAARILQIEEYLDRKPKALSGGQRQRVALGRAIVRYAKVFLMDEPLSNLDAKLRVQMRSEIVKLHEGLNATTIYVTHDQTEAMTMASRIVVMKLGRIQQIGSPKEIYNNPYNLFVAGFIGSPSMNFFQAVYKDGTVIVEGGTKFALPKKIAEGKNIPEKIILGIRPEDIHPALSETGKKFPDAIVKTDIRVAELLGSEYYLHSDFGGIDMVAKFPAEKEIKIGDKVDMALNLDKIKLFDPVSELAL